MTKTIYLVRHAQGGHHVADDCDMRDALLSPHGKEECQALRATFPFHHDIEVVMASPLRRAIQTAIESFMPALMRRDVPLLLVPHAREEREPASDAGRAREELEVETAKILGREAAEGGFDARRIDCRILEPGWSRKSGRFEASLTAVDARAAELRAWLWRRPEQSVVLVTHGAFLRSFADEADAFAPAHGTAYKSCEFRAFNFTADSNEREAHLVQVGKGGRLAGRPPASHSGARRGAEL